MASLGWVIIDGVLTFNGSFNVSGGNLTVTNGSLVIPNGSNAESGGMDWASNVFEVGNTTGSGTLRNLRIKSPGLIIFANAGTDAWEFSAGNLVDLGSHSITIGGALSMGGVLTKYNGTNTAGWGTPSIYGSGRVTAQVAAAASIATYTPGSDGSLLISANVNVTTYSSGTFTVTCTYTDEGNTSRTFTLNFSNIAGTIGPNIAAAGAFEGLTYQIRAKSGTSVTLASSGTFTSLTYNAEGTIARVA